MINPLSSETLVDAHYIIGTRPTEEHDGNPLFEFEVFQGKLQNFRSEIRNPPSGFQNISGNETFGGSVSFLIKSGDWCTTEQLDNPDNLAKYLVVTANKSGN